MRHAIAAGLVVITGCAGAPPALPPPTGAPPQVAATGGGRFNSTNVEIRLALEDRRYRGAFAASIDDAAAAVRQAFTAVGVQALTLSVAPRVVGVDKQVWRRTLGGKPLSTYLDCGITPQGVLANSYRITASALAAVEALGKDSVVVEARLTAEAVTNEGASGAPVACTSTGALEKRLLEEARLALGRSTH